MNFYFTQVAEKKFLQLATNDQKRIFKKILWFCQQPDPFVFARVLKNTEIGSFRWRIGKFRVIFDVEDEEIYILDVDRRDRIY